ncbi:MAG: tRNA uridine(34) 5-carboxymethylaminomethyl modification radical SAM/GNAT enzyme Elp3 [Candidatus Bathyarchaeota archaeon]|nr:tRNA uridine(34) 5-carboxymethylaminomethyl modification radical SAM/GNAT enzyme Elp3 [Candidatus Bathyarchaeota archaeon]
MSEKNSDKACREIAKELLHNKKKISELNKLKLDRCKKYGLEILPKNSEILLSLESVEKEEISKKIRIKNVRSISGINIVSVMSKPFDCPHGRCAYCPQESGVPNSYTGHEPAAMRGLQNGFDPFRQVSNRLAQLKAIGHSINKVELIIQGGTFPAMAVDYQKNFVKQSLDAIIGSNSKSIEDAKNKAETSELKNVGITVETRPDWGKEDNVDLMLDLGVTRVEVGVQTLDDNIHRLIERGHATKDVTKSFQVIKDSGLKIVAHMMPGLPDSNMDKDLDSFKRLFTEEEFKPDMIKIYPCLVLKGTKIYKWWLEGKYKPYDTNEAAELIVKIKEMVPPWVRIMRIQRDIPTGLIEDGVKKSNLRQIVQERMKERGLKCRCIRCREVGHRMMREGLLPKDGEISLQKTIYRASKGIEIFISCEDSIRDILIGYLRLRIPSELAHRSEITNNTSSLIREVHVYGPLVPVGKHTDEDWQHKGYGKELISEAERISLEDFDRDKILVTSALGVRKYFERFSYISDGPYMSKILR